MERKEMLRSELRHVHPEIAQTVFCSGRDPITAKEPQVAIRIDPFTRFTSGAGNVTRRKCALSAVHPILIDQSGPGHPRPLPVFVPPQIVEKPGLSNRAVASSTEKPEIPRRIRPASGPIPRPRDVSRSWNALCAVHTALIDKIGAGYPCPFSHGVFPQIIERSMCPIRVVTKSTGEPEVPGWINPTYSLNPCTG